MMYYYNEENDVYIWFYNNRKTIEIVNEFTLDILQAINQQVNELGWKNEYMIHIAKDFEQLQQENKQLKDKIPYIIQNNACRYISIEKCKNKVCVNYEIQELEGSDSNVKD